MAADASVNARIQAMGIGLIGLAEGTLTFQATLLPQAPSIIALWVVKWSRFLGLMSEVPAQLSRFASRRIVDGGRPQSRTAAAPSSSRSR